MKYYLFSRNYIQNAWVQRLPSINKYLLNIYYKQGSGDISMNKIHNVVTFKEIVF